MALEPFTTTLSAVLRNLLKTAHLQKDIYFSGFFHTHLCHGLLSLNSMHNMTDEELEAHYKAQSKMLQDRPKPLSSVGEITVENWYERMDGGVKASGNFLDFFDQQIGVGASQQELTNAVLTYAFDPRAASRLLGGAIHALIHLGYACELITSEPETARLLLIEALAMQCTTKNQFQTAIESLQPLDKVNKKEPPLETSGGNRVLHVLNAMSSDPALVDVPTRDNPDKVDYTISRTDVMQKYYNMFPVTDVQTAFEHLFLGALAIVFGSISATPGKEPRLDFFLAHCLTSAVSLRQVLPFVPDNNDNVAATLCRYHFVAMLAWHRARGYPTIDIANLMNQSADLDWNECESQLRANPALEVHSLKVLRALELAKSELWAVDAIKRGLLPGADERVWLICANILVKQIDSGAAFGGFKWLHFGDAWDYYRGS